MPETLEGALEAVWHARVLGHQDALERAHTALYEAANAVCERTCGCSFDSLLLASERSGLPLLTGDPVLASVFNYAAVLRGISARSTVVS